MTVSRIAPHHHTRAMCFVLPHAQDGGASCFPSTQTGVMEKAILCGYVVGSGLLIAVMLALFSRL